MDRKRIAKRLEKAGFILGQDIFGWIVQDIYTGFERKFSTLGQVNRFLNDEEKMSEYIKQYRCA